MRKNFTTEDTEITEEAGRAVSKPLVNHAHSSSVLSVSSVVKISGDPITRVLAKTRVRP